MHTRVINERNRVARATIRATAERLAERLGVPPLEAVNAIEGRDPAVAPMRELECIAVLLQDVERALGDGTKPSPLIPHYLCNCQTRTLLLPGVTVCPNCGKPFQLAQEIHHGSEQQTEDRPRQRGRRAAPVG